LFVTLAPFLLYYTESTITNVRAILLEKHCQLPFKLSFGVIPKQAILGRIIVEEQYLVISWGQVGGIS
jgi:hypothetical protein